MVTASTQLYEVMKLY